MMSNKSKFSIVVSIAVLFIVWLSLFYQIAFKTSPAGSLQYITENQKNWEEEGYPHAYFPCFIDRDSVWMFSNYQKSNSGKTGFIRFHLKDKQAKMDWLIPGLKHYGYVIGIAKAKNGEIAVLFSTEGKYNLYCLLPKGGVKRLGTFQNRSSLNLIKGIAWVKQKIEIVMQEYRGKSVAIYRHKGGAKWEKRIIDYKNSPAQKTLLGVARYRKGKWNIYFYEYKLKKKYRTSVYLYQEGSKRSEEQAKISIVNSNLYNVIDPSSGGIIKWRINMDVMKTPRYQVKNGNLVKIIPGPLALKKQKIIPAYYNMYALKQNTLSRIFIWTSQSSYTTTIQIGKREYDFIYKRDSKARRKRKVLFLESLTKESKDPIVESFRFQSNPILVPSSNNEMWILGVFGYYVKVDKDLNRCDPLSIKDRFSRMFHSFGSRRAQYNDFYLYYGDIKKHILPVILFSLPLLWFLGIVLFLILRIFFKKLNIFSVLSCFSLLYIILFFISGYWLWEIIINF